MNIAKALILVGMILTTFLILSNPAQPVGGDWTSFTLNNSDTRFQANSTITSSNVGNLISAWNISTMNSVTSTPIVFDGNVYFADWGGFIYSANILTGHLNSGFGSSLTPGKENLGGGVSSTPLLYNGILYVAFGPNGAADVGHSVRVLEGNTTVVYALNPFTGSVIWFDNLNKTTNMGAIWASPLVYKNILYIGVASQGDESEASWKGALYGIYANNGVMAWNALGSPNAIGYGSTILAKTDGGEGLWGSIVIDPNLNSVYFGVGNPFSLAHNPSNTFNALYGYSIMSLNATTGQIKWYRQVYNVTHGVNTSSPDNGMVTVVNSSYSQWNDDDFGSTPNLFTLTSTANSISCNLGCNAIGLGNKDGNYYVLNRLNGNFIRKVNVGSSQTFSIDSDGGIIGVAGMTNTTNPEIFADSYFDAANGTANGIVEAFYPSNGVIAWKHPTSGCIEGSVAVIPGAVLVGDWNSCLSDADKGKLYAFSTATGNTLFSHNLQGGMAGGVSVGEGYVFATSLISSNNATLGLYAFTLPQPKSLIALALSNTSIDQGQSILFTASNVPSGTGPYTYNYQIVNSITGATIANQLYKSVASTTNAFFWTPPSKLYTANTFKANVIVTTSSTTLSSIYQPFGYNAALNPTLSASITPTVSVGSSEVFSANAGGGTSKYTYNYQIFNSVTGALLGNYLSPLVTQAGNTYTWVVPSADMGNTISANVIITDHPTVPTTATSAKINPITISNAPNQTVQQMISSLQNNGYTNVTNNEGIATTSSPAVMFFAFDSNAFGTNLGGNVLVFALPLGYEFTNWVSSNPTAYDYNTPSPANTPEVGTITFFTVPANDFFAGDSSGQGPWITYKELVPTITITNKMTTTTTTTSSTTTSITTTTSSVSTSLSTTLTTSSTTSSSTTSSTTSSSSTYSTTSTTSTSSSTVTTIAAGPLAIAAPLPQTQNTPIGNTATINDSGASGGVGPYTYQWLEEQPNASVFTNALDCTNQTNTICTFITNALGNYTFELNATDSAANTVTSTNAIVIVVSTSTTTTSTSVTTTLPTTSSSTTITTTSLPTTSLTTTSSTTSLPTTSLSTSSTTSTTTSVTTTIAQNQTVNSMITTLKNDGFTNVTTTQSVATISSPAIMFIAFDKTAHGSGKSAGGNVLVFALPLGYEYAPGGWTSNSPTVYTYLNQSNAIKTGTITYKTIPANAFFGGSSSGTGPWVTYKELIAPPQYNPQMH